MANDVQTPKTLRRFAGCALARPLVMGVVNVTPDSFSDGGDSYDTGAAIARGLKLAQDGADILDVGGESTRPGAAPVPPEEELSRVLPVIDALARAGLVVSIDTRRAVVMRRALAAGARIVNDVSALAGDPDSLAIVAASGASAILMHMQGEPGTMQVAPRYGNVVAEVERFLAQRLAAALAAGMTQDRLAIDPGIGFGKTLADNLALLNGLAMFHGLGCPILLGASRKRLIGALSNEAPVGDRLAGSLALALKGVEAGVQILRVHDVAETVQALRVWRGMRDLALVGG
jgi:dihydropteroate synthase